MWRKLDGAENGQLLPMLASSTQGIYTTDVGRLVFESSGRGRLVTIGTSTGSTDPLGSTVGGLKGIIMNVPADCTADSTKIFYFSPLQRFELVEGNYTASSTDSGSSGEGAGWITTTNIGQVFKFVGQGCSSGSTYRTSTDGCVQDFITDATAAPSGSSLGAFVMTDYSTKRKTIRGYFIPEMFKGITQSTG